jgi:hypothetical protein
MEIYYYYSTAATKETRAASLPLFLPLEVGHLKLHTVDDVDLSHSLGIDFGCAGYKSEYDNNDDGWYD